ncbi:endolytic transglycosylase MltG [Actinomycetospora atypica]|uniref:Endolytic murein transglycosylase n=1 Tax=Actinomycetospora atypica TaxID=1290095 RepID=A0ABV9YXJ9_9PSEU
MTRSQDATGSGRRIVPLSPSTGSPSSGSQRPGQREGRVPRRGLRRPGGDVENATTALTAQSGEHDAVTDTLSRRDAVLPTTPSRVPLPGPLPRGWSRTEAADRPARERPRTDPGDRPPRAGAPEPRARERFRPDDRPEYRQARPVPPAWQPPGPPAAAAGPAARDVRPDDDQGDLGLLGGLAPASSSDDDHRDGGDRRRRLLWPLVAAFLVLALAGGAYFARDLWGVAFPPDYDGPGTGHVVVQVADGDSTRDIGESLVTAGVVASARGFGQAAEEDPRGRGIQPGFYDMARGMPAADAVTRMLEPATRLGLLDVRGGTQLDDTAGAAGARVPGVLSLISAATCVVEDSGERRCASVDDLRRTMADTDPARLGVPSWALADVRRALPERRLEGLVAPGTYDVRPGSDAAEALTSVVGTSVGRLEAGGLVTKAAANDVTPYQALVVGSIAEREGVESDFRRIARVVYNRLPIPMRLQMDSTINYPLDRQTLLTTPVDRAAPGPYNTYLNFGLPPTPIGAVSTPALQAALAPEVGGWVYFVKCENDGTSCFAVSPEEHDANRRLAQARGVY